MPRGMASAVMFVPPSYGPGKPCSRFRKCPYGEVFDMHGPEQVFLHLPHIADASSQIWARRLDLRKWPRLGGHSLLSRPSNGDA